MRNALCQSVCTPNVTATSNVDETSHTTNKSAKNKTDTAEHYYTSGTKGRNWKRIKISGRKIRR